MELEPEVRKVETSDAARPPDEMRADPAAVHVGEFSQDILLELRRLSRGARCAYLSYLLELALIEASDLASGKPPTRVVKPEESRTEPVDIAVLLKRIVAEA